MSGWDALRQVTLWKGVGRMPGKDLYKAEEQLEFLTVSVCQSFYWVLFSHISAWFSALVQAAPGFMRSFSIITIICVLSGLLRRPRTLPPPDLSFSRILNLWIELAVSRLDVWISLGSIAFHPQPFNIPTSKPVPINTQHILTFPTAFPSTLLGFCLCLGAHFPGNSVTVVRCSGCSTEADSWYMVTELSFPRSRRPMLLREE